MRRATITMLGLALATPAVAADPPARTPEQIAHAFGARETVQQISLSPNGLRVAIIVATKGSNSVLVIGDAEKGLSTKAILGSTGRGDQLSACHWATDTRLICDYYLVTTVGSQRLGFSRVVAINADGSDMKELTARTHGDALGVMQDGGSLIDWGASADGKALMTRSYVPERVTGTMTSQTRTGLGVDIVDTNTLRRRIVEQPRDTAVEYISDGQGVVRVMGVRPSSNEGYDGKRVVYSYRLPDSREWKPLSVVTIAGTVGIGFSPVAVDRTLNVVYGYENTSGRTGLYSISLDGNLIKKLVLERPDVDISGLIRIGRQERVVGASYITDRREVAFFDPALKALQLSLGKALPGRLVAFVDASADESKLLLYAWSDVDPGTYYLFDKKSRSLAPVLPTHPDLAGLRLAAVKPVTYRAADGTTIPAYLTLPVGTEARNLPAIVMPHGGPDSRDQWGFDWLAQFFAARGYAVIQPEFRGSAGYGDAWYNRNGFQSWRTAIGDVNDAGRWLIKSGIADPAKLAIVGWSYGGYAALQTAVLDPDLFKAIVAVAPVTDLETLRDEARDYSYFPQRDAQIGHGPWVTEGSPAPNAARIKAPVLLFHGDRDQNVGIGESRLMAGKIKAAGGKVELVEYGGLDHQLDDSDVRANLLTRADAFLRTAMGIQP